MALFLFVIIIAIALGILGIVLKGLFWLLIIGIVTVPGQPGLRRDAAG